MSLVPKHPKDEYTEILSDLLPLFVEWLMITLKNDLDSLLYTFGCLIKTCKSFYRHLYTERYSPSITRLWNQITCPSLRFGEYDRSHFDKLDCGEYDRSHFDKLDCSMHMNHSFLTNQERLHPFTFLKVELGYHNQLGLRDLRTPARFFITLKNRIPSTTDVSMFFDYVRDIDYNLNTLKELGRPCATVHIVYKVNISHHHFTLESLTESKSGQVILSLHICGNGLVTIPDNLQGWERSYLSISKCELSISDNAQFNCHTFIMINLSNWTELSKLKINAEVIRFIDLHILEDLNLSRMDWTCKEGVIRFRDRSYWRRIVKNAPFIYQKKNFDLEIHKK